MSQAYGYRNSSVGAVAIQIAGLQEMIGAQRGQIAALNKELRAAHVRTAQLVKELEKLKRDRRHAEHA